MVCGSCHQKISDIELYCKLCGADLQIFSSEKYPSSPKVDKKDEGISIQQTEKLREDIPLPFAPQESITSFIPPSPSPFINEATQFNPPEISLPQNNNFDLNIPNISSREKDTLSDMPEAKIPTYGETKEEPKEKPLYTRYFLDEEEKK